MEDRKFIWVHVVLISYLINFTSILLSRIILDVNVSKENMVAFILIAVVIALFYSLGYFSCKYFIKSFLAFNVLSIITLFYVSIFKTSDNWSDLSSLVMYVFINILGILISILIEFISRYIKNKKPKEEISIIEETLVIEKENPIKEKALKKPKEVSKKKPNKKKTNKKSSKKNHKKK